MLISRGGRSSRKCAVVAVVKTQNIVVAACHRNVEIEWARPITDSKNRNNPQGNSCVLSTNFERVLITLKMLRFPGVGINVNSLIDCKSGRRYRRI